MFNFQKIFYLQYFQRLAGLIVVCLGLSVHVQAAEKEPIAYIGHGAFFDHDGKQIVPTSKFVAKAHDWYRTKLLLGLKDDKKAEFLKLEKQLNASVKAEGQANLVVSHHLIDWLLAHSKGVNRDGRTLGKLNALKYALNWQLPDRADLKEFQLGEPFKMSPTLAHKLKLPEFNPSDVPAIFATPTVNSGQAYINECMAAGVPIPPPIGNLGVGQWLSRGFIPQAQQFIVGTPAEVRTFTSPAGICVALPRYTDNSLATVRLDGVICLGQASNNVCFWDNQMNGSAFTFPSGTQIPIGVPNLAINPAGQYQAGGAELAVNGSVGGVCTDCHAGQNPYIIHPNANLGGGQLMGNLGTASSVRYDPHVAASWPQNQRSMSQTLVPPVCVGCHVTGGLGGAFPHLSSELPDYCGMILAQAVSGPKATMPPGSAGSAASDAAVIAFRAWCGMPASAGPSNRGEPHITTTNGVHYDFQSAGEFIALRGGDGFEIQTRQTPVATAAIIGPDAHTGLTSCVSVNTAVAARVGKHRVTFQPNLNGEPDPRGLQLRVDGELTTLSQAGIDFLAGGRILSASAGNGIEIEFPDKTRLIVTPGWWGAPQNLWYLHLDIANTPAREGIMGTILPGNWLPLLPDGTPMGPIPASLNQRYVDLNQKFADAWRVSNRTSLFDYASNTSTDTFTMSSWPPEKPPCIIPASNIPPAEPIDKLIAEDLCRLIADKNMHAECVFDVTVTGEAGFAKTYMLTQKILDGQRDSDQDGVVDNRDNCPHTYNPEQKDRDGDGVGDACENLNQEICDGVDNNGDGFVDEGFPDTDQDGTADCVDKDDDNDGFSDEAEMFAGSDPLNKASTPEICDGIDNDLDGFTDEGCLSHLNVTKAGTGAGNVTSNPAGINCGTDCSEAYSHNTVVTLMATANTGSIFTGWSGPDAGECATGHVLMAADKRCTATFMLKPTLTVTKILIPSTDAGKFNLLMNGVIKASNVGNGGTTGSVIRNPGFVSVSETAGTNTSLANYTTVIGGNCAANGAITLVAGDNKTCTITNTRK